MLAITALTGSLFMGTQILARLSTDAPGSAESIAAGGVALLLVYVLGNVSHSTTDDPGSRFVRCVAQTRRARKPLLIGASMMFASIPRIELSSQSYLGLVLRLGLGVLVAVLVGRHANRWLLGMSLLTIVLHRWTHPQLVTLTFIGLILIGFALSTRSEMVDGQSNQTYDHATVAHSGIRSVQGFRYPALVVAGVALSLIGAVLLGDHARQLAWKPDGRRSGFNGLGAVGGNGPPQQRFNALQAQDQLDLSYRPTRSTQEVMTLYTEEPTPVFLRAQTFDRWTGKTWKNGRLIPFDDQVQSGSWLVRPSFQDTLATYMRSRPDPLSPNEPTQPEGRSDRMVVETKVRFNGYTPVPVEPVAIITDIDAPSARWRSDGTVTPIGDEGPSLYVVLHELDAPRTYDMSRTDLLDTTEVSTRAKQLAAQITQGKTSVEDKAAAISRWVTSNIKYNLNAKAPQRDVDQIDYILFDAKEGSCTHFATVTAALFRSAGIPARIATGFVGQTRVLPKQIQVQAKDAHAWAEVPQMAGHWKIFDTTLGSVEVVPAKKRVSVMSWLPAVLAGLIALALVARRRFRLRAKHYSGNQALWDEILDIGVRIGLVPAKPLSYRKFSEHLDSTLGMNGKLASLGVELDRRTFGPSGGSGGSGGSDGSGDDSLYDTASDTLIVARSRADKLAKQHKAEARLARRQQAWWRRRWRAHRLLND